MAKRSLLAALVVLVVLPATAAAAQFAGGSVGAPPTKVNRGIYEQIWFKSPPRLPGKMDVAIEVDNVRCNAPAFGAPANAPVSTGIRDAKDVKVARDGTFSTTIALEDTNVDTGERSRGRARLKGRLRGASARGKVSGFISVTDANGAKTARCELAPTRWFADTGRRVSRERPARPDGRRYFGVNETRDSFLRTRYPAIVNLDRARKQGGMTVRYNAPCEEGVGFPRFETADYSPVFRVKKGTFTVRETYDNGNPAGPGFGARIRTRYGGAFVKGGVSGTFRIRVTAFQDGAKTGHCDTGIVKWRALSP